MNGEIVSFLTPSPEHGIEVVFFSIIVGSTIMSLITSELLGRPAAWERNWQGGSRSAALDIEHGSISELSHAVATLAERIAVNLPGLLLIFGLLGTFLGLGLALDKASSILQGNDDSLNAMSSSLSQLTGMMKDLGTKFKTSTWGIMAFITLKLWESARWSADSRRVNWCLKMMKNVIDQERARHRAEREKQQLEAHEVLERTGQLVVESITSQSVTLSDELRQLKAIAFQQGQIRQELIRYLTKSLKSVDTQLAEQHKQFESISGHGLRSADLLEEFVGSSRDNLQALQQAGSTMGSAALEVANSATALQHGVDALGQRMNQVLDSMQADLNGTINRMNKDFASNLQDMGSQLQNTIGHLGQVMDSIKSDLGQTIETMSNDFKRSTLEMADQLGNATSEISGAITHLNENVGGVMAEVKQTTVQANEIQKKTSVGFVQTSDSLNAATVSMTERMNELGREIKSGLSAVSKSSMQVQSIISKLDSFPELPRQFQVLADTAKSGNERLDTLVTYLDRMTTMTHGIP
ncbi:TPA: methyl-accepting chemotaxis protein, partial [Pseudomonas aeruginosa]|nr:methyl-accepting chemotaxis protein [Pseudomonas aeruginosa]HCF4894126.1 methyl-accepting chemotaxis protein [Pseudomonas aeruginosa]HCF5103610.1 methyl-accepting chemotaxis protein [Pseudomonas aeruginosa]